MKTSLKVYRGFTLLEVLFVLVIVSAFLVLGFQTYKNLVFEQQLQQVKYNIDTQFQGLRSYYLANCRANRSYTTGSIINTTTGQLDKSSYTVNKYNVNIPASLTGYLTNWPPPLTQQPSFVKSYIAQFNLQNNVPRNVNFCYQGACTSLQTVNSSTYIWVAQVSIQVDPTLAKMYQGLLNAECISDSPDGTYVVPCSYIPGSYTPTTKNYLVFTRLPSMALSETGATMWPSVPNLKNFTQQYTNDENYAVTVDDSAYNSSTEYETYLCGG